MPAGAAGMLQTEALQAAQLMAHSSEVASGPATRSSFSMHLCPSHQELESQQHEGQMCCSQR
jgi:hypothetical protein